MITCMDQNNEKIEHVKAFGAKDLPVKIVHCYEVRSGQVD